MQGEGQHCTVSKNPSVIIVPHCLIHVKFQLILFLSHLRFYHVTEKYPRSVWANAEACQPTVEPDYLHLEEMFREKNVFDDSTEVFHQSQFSVCLKF